MIEKSLNNCNVGVYARHSKDDEHSQTIDNQIGIMSTYVKTNSGVISKKYIDDGKSGVSLDRPSFKLLLNDISLGLIDTVITKDLSRLARNYLEAGYLMENFFPQNKVRYIAINDNYDSNSDDDGIAPIKNLFNEWYSRDISKKTITAKRNSAKEGKFLGSRSPYGYIIEKSNKHKLIVDNKYSKNIKLIFNLFLKTNSIRAVAEGLNTKKISPPSARFKSEKININNGWSSGTISAILENEVYIGHMVNGKTKNFSYKDQRKVKAPKNNWIIVKNTHEAIISTEVFEKARQMRASTYLPRKKTSKIKSTLTGLCFCVDCCSKMVLSRRKYKNDEKVFLRCSGYNQKGSSFCTPHNIREVFLIEELKSYCIKILKENQKDNFNLINLGNDNLSKQISEQVVKYKGYKIMVKESEVALINTIKKSTDYPALNNIFEIFQNEITLYKKEIEELNLDIKTKKSVYKIMDKKIDSLIQFLEISENYLFETNFMKIFSKINIHQTKDSKTIKFTVDFRFN